MMWGVTGSAMFRPLVTVLVLAPLAACSDPVPALPAPVFTRATGVPGFIVECRNTAERPLSPVEQLGALRLDGAVIEARGGIGSLLGGFPPDVPPGQTWKVVVVLHPGKVVGTVRTLEFPPRVQRVDRAVPLIKGRHRVAFQCAGEWTEEVAFDW